MKQPNAKYVLGKHVEGQKYENLTEIKEVKEVDSGGTGIMLVHRKVFETLSDPWYTILDGKDLFVMPEDFEFCRKAKEAGFRIVADPRFATRHYGTKAYCHEP